MKLTRLIIGFLTFATALFLSHTCFVMVERGIEHVDPIEIVRKAERESWDKEWNDLMHPGTLVKGYLDQGNIWKSTNKIKAIQDKLDNFTKIVDSKNLKADDKLNILDKIVSDIKAVEEYDRTNVQGYAKIKTDVLKQFEKPVTEYLKQSSILLIQERNQGKSLTLQLTTEGYEQEFRTLATFISIATKLGITNTNVETAAKRLLRLQQFLTKKQSWTSFIKNLPTGAIHDIISREVLESLIKDKIFVQANNASLQSKWLTNNENYALPEDMLALLVTDFENVPENARAQEYIDILKRVENIIPLIIDKADLTKTGTIINDFLKSLDSSISEKLSTRNGSLGDPSDARKKEIEDLQTFRDYLNKSTVLKNASALIKKIDTIIANTKAYDTILRKNIEDKVRKLSSQIDEASFEILNDQQRIKRYQEELAELLKQCEIFEKYSYEKFAVQDFRSILQAWTKVLEMPRNISNIMDQFKRETPDFEAIDKAYTAIQINTNAIQLSLNYNIQDPFSPNKVTRSFDSRLIMMKNQSAVLAKTSKLLKQQTVKVNGKVYALVDIPRLSDKEFAKQKAAILQNYKFVDNGVDTDKGKRFKWLSDLSWSIERRIKQLEVYTKDNANKKSPDQIKSRNGFNIKLAEDLQLNLFIPDDQILLLKDQYRKLKLYEQNQLLSTIKSGSLNIASQLADMTELFELYKKTVTNLNQNINDEDAFFAQIVSYALEAIRTPDKTRIQSLVDVYVKYPLLLRAFGSDDPEALIPLSERAITDESDAYMNEAERSAKKEAAILAVKAELEKLIAAENRSHFDWPTELGKAAAVAATVYYSQAIATAIGFVIGGIVGVVVGLFTGPGVFLTAYYGALGGAAIGGLVGGAWQKGLDQITNGWGTRAIAIGAATYCFGKAAHDAYVAKPTEQTWRQWEDKAIQAQIMPSLRPYEPGVWEPYENKITAWFGNKTDILHANLATKPNEMQQRIRQFEKAKQAYCDLINKTLGLQGASRLTTTSSYDYFVSTTQQFNKAIDANTKMTQNQKISLKTEAEATFNMMQQTGRESIKLQFQYAEGLHTLISEVVFSDLFDQATRENTQAFDTSFEVPPAFINMYKEDYQGMQPTEARAAAQTNFVKWLDFYKRLFEQHNAFVSSLEKNQEKILKPFKKDASKVFNFYKDMLDGRLDLMLKLFRTTCDNIAVAQGYKRLDWEKATARPVTKAT